MTERITYMPIRNETVVAMRGNKVIGTIKRYRAHRRCIVNIPGILTASSNPGEANFATINEAKRRIREIETAQITMGKIVRPNEASIKDRRP